MRRIAVGLLTAGGALGAIGALNALVRRSAPALPDPVVGRQEAHLWTWGRVAYSVEGAGPSIVLVHGIHAAAWSYEMRELFGPLSSTHRVYAPDLLGFGASDRPALQYTAALYVDLLANFLREIVQQPCHLVASSLSGAYAVEVARRLPEQVTRLTLICPTGLESLTEPPSAAGHALNLLLRAPITGEALFNLLVSKPSIRYYLARLSYYDLSFITDRVVERYYASAHRPHARYAPAAFLGGYLNRDIREAYQALTQPVLVIWGQDAIRTPVAQAKAFEDLNPRARLAVLERCRLLPHVERADDVVHLILEHEAATTGEVQPAR